MLIYLVHFYVLPKCHQLSYICTYIAAKLKSALQIQKQKLACQLNIIWVRVHLHIHVVMLWLEGVVIAPSLHVYICPSFSICVGTSGRYNAEPHARESGSV